MASPVDGDAHRLMLQLMRLTCEEEELRDRDAFIDSIWKHVHVDTVTAYRCLSHMCQIGMIKRVSATRTEPPAADPDSLEP